MTPLCGNCCELGHLRDECPKPPLSPDVRLLSVNMRPDPSPNSDVRIAAHMIASQLRSLKPEQWAEAWALAKLKVQSG